MGEVTTKSVEIKVSFAKTQEENQLNRTLIATKLSRLTNGETIVSLTAKKEDYFLKANLANHRERLEEDKPCPLCGSLSHPYRGCGQEFAKELERLEDTIEKAENLEREGQMLQEREKELKNSYEREMLLFTERVKNLKDAVETATAELTVKKTEYEKLKPDYDDLRIKRFNLLEDKSPEAEAARLKKAKSGAQALLRDVQTEREDVTAALIRLKTQNDAILAAMAEGEKERINSENILKEELAKEGFADLDVFQNFILAESEIARLEKIEAELADRKKAVDMRREDRAKRAEKIEKTALTLPPLSELEQERDDVLSKLEGMASDSRDCLRRLEENELLKAEAAKLAEKTENQQKK
ncbi:MAG: hypothetical protein LBD73_02255 [Deferribacteraceae bacterium]|jgi:exonuclease SbcC|nr:hypothetical protein [Deferribacteraceae bacterium]